MLISEKDRQDGPDIKVFVAKPDKLDLIYSTSMVEGENLLLHILLWPHVCALARVHVHTHAHTWENMELEDECRRKFCKCNIHVWTSQSTVLIFKTTIVISTWFLIAKFGSN